MTGTVGSASTVADVFIPVSRRLSRTRARGVAHGVGLLAAFLVSGAVHELVLYIRYAQWNGLAISAFLVQGVAVVVWLAAQKGFKTIVIRWPTSAAVLSAPVQLGGYGIFWALMVTTGYLLIPALSGAH